MIHILFMILKALGILLLVLLFLVLLIVCTVLFLPFCYRAQVLKEEEGFACVKASGRVSWLFRSEGTRLNSSHMSESRMPSSA